MKGSVCLLEFKKIDTKCKVHGLWFTLTLSLPNISLVNEIFLSRETC